MSGFDKFNYLRKRDIAAEKGIEAKWDSRFIPFIALSEPGSLGSQPANNVFIRRRGVDIARDFAVDAFKVGSLRKCDCCRCIPRLPHPLHAVLTQQALASGVQPPPTPAAPHIAPLPEGFELDPPVTSQLHQPASARGQAPKRPAPETVKVRF